MIKSAKLQTKKKKKKKKKKKTVRVPENDVKVPADSRQAAHIGRFQEVGNTVENFRWNVEDGRLPFFFAAAAAAAAAVTPAPTAAGVPRS